MSKTENEQEPTPSASREQAPAAGKVVPLRPRTQGRPVPPDDDPGPRAA